MSKEGALRAEDVYQELVHWREHERPGLPTARRIAERLGLSESTTRRYLAELVAREWVRKEVLRGAYGWRMVQQFFAVPGHEWDEL